MVPAVALLLLQAPLTGGALHAEDAKVMEAALVHHWQLQAPESLPVFVVDHTHAPLLGQAFVGSDGKTLEGLDPAIRRVLEVRNKTTGSLRWFRPKNARLRLPVPTPMEDGSEYHQYAWLLFPGYSPNRRRAVVCFGFNVGTHPGRSTVWLTKWKGLWKVERESTFVLY